MKLVYIHQYFKFPDETGGTRSYDLAHSFVSKGYEVEVVTTTSEEKYNTGQKWTIIEREGIRVNYIYLPYDNNLSHLKRILVFLQFLWFATFRILKLRSDLVLATSTPLTIGIPAILNKWIKKTPYIFEVRDVWPEAVVAIGAIKNKFVQKGLYYLEYLIYKNAFYIVPLSTDMQKSIVSRYPQFANKTQVVIENIAEVNRFSKPKDSFDLESIIGFKPRFTVLYAGTFGRVNGIDSVINLASYTIDLDPKLVYVLVGSGTEKNSIISLATEKGLLNKNVFILDPISKSELPSLYSSVSMGSSFVIDIPELWANSANKFFDTLAAAKPILINHEGWQANVIRARNIGYVLPNKLDINVAKDFVSYTANFQLQQEQSLNAFQIADEDYSLTIATNKYLQIINNINNV